MTICIIENCDVEISERSQLAICPLCRGTLYRWRKRRPAEILQRRTNLVKYSSRMDNLSAKGARK